MAIYNNPIMCDSFVDEWILLNNDLQTGHLTYSDISHNQGKGFPLMNLSFSVKDNNQVSKLKQW